jgi:hypothetical protein
MPFSPLGLSASAAYTALFLNRLAARISELADGLTDLAQLAEVDRFRYCERPHKSARESTCNDSASGNKIQSFVFHIAGTRITARRLNLHNYTPHHLQPWNAAK